VERDRFVSHLYQSRRQYRRTCEAAGKSGKQTERCVISSFQIAESMGFKGEISPMGGSPADQRLNADYPCLHSRFSKSVDFRKRLRMGISSDWMFVKYHESRSPKSF
jgi:hypothetical protein